MGFATLAALLVAPVVVALAVLTAPVAGDGVLAAAVSGFTVLAAVAAAGAGFFVVVAAGVVATVFAAVVLAAPAFAVSAVAGVVGFPAPVVALLAGAAAVVFGFTGFLEAVLGGTLRQYGLCTLPVLSLGSFGTTHEQALLDPQPA